MARKQGELKHVRPPQFPHNRLDPLCRQTETQSGAPGYQRHLTAVNIRRTVTGCLLVAILLCAAVAFGQQDGTQLDLGTIKSQVAWIKSMLVAGQIDAQKADDQIKALQQQAGELAMNGISTTADAKGSDTSARHAKTPPPPKGTSCSTKDANLKLPKPVLSAYDDPTLTGSISGQTSDITVRIIALTETNEACR